MFYYRNFPYSSEFWKVNGSVSQFDFNEWPRGIYFDTYLLNCNAAALNGWLNCQVSIFLLPTFLVTKSYMPWLRAHSFKTGCMKVRKLTSWATFFKIHIQLHKLYHCSAWLITVFFFFFFGKYTKTRNKFGNSFVSFKHWSNAHAKLFSKCHRLSSKVCEIKRVKTQTCKVPTEINNEKRKKCVEFNYFYLFIFVYMYLYAYKYFTCVRMYFSLCL